MELLFPLSFSPFTILSPVLVSELDEPVEHHHVGVDLPGEHIELVRVRRVATVTRVMAALHTGCQLDKPWGYIIVTPDQGDPDTNIIKSLFCLALCHKAGLQRGFCRIIVESWRIFWYFKVFFATSNINKDDKREL